MKRAGFLFEKIVEPDNLCLAFVKAVRGKSARREVVEFRADFTANMRGIRERLVSGDFCFGEYASFRVRDPKNRLIHAAPFRQRIVHHAVMNVCEPVFERYAIHDSFACRPGKGLRRAILRCREFARRHAWYLKLDIHKYFDSIRHQTVMELLERRIKDSRVLSLFFAILDSYHTIPGRGLPIGNLISQHLANLYLGGMDHWLKEERRVRGYLRYMDDFVLFARDAERLKQELEGVAAFLEQRLALRLHHARQLNHCGRGLPFLGFRIFPHQIRLGRRSRRRFVEKFRRYEELYAQGYWDERQLSDHVRPLIEFTRNGDTRMFRTDILQRYGALF